jgi:hypothetical protein
MEINTMDELTKVRVTVAEMSRMVGLSRSRFYQLLGTTFPKPQYDDETNRPYYDDEHQQVCLDVRRRNCGIDGRPVMFYSCSPTPVRKPRTRKQAATASGQFDALIENVRALGMTTATREQIVSAVKELFPSGTDDTPSAEVVRSVFVYLKRQESST